MGDELGVDPDGHMYKITAFVNGVDSYRLNKKLVRLTTDEKAPFWVSIFFWSNSAGWVSQPMIVHKGKTLSEAMVRTWWENSNKTHELPKLWKIRSTESGYMDEEGFKACLDLLEPLRSMNERNSLLVIVDGHYSHMNADTMLKARGKNIYILFLASHTSRLTQTGDNGPNSHIKSNYDQFRAEVMREVGEATQMNVSLFNEAFKRAWEFSLLQLPRIASEAANRCGWFYLRQVGTLEPKFVGIDADNYKNLEFISAGTLGETPEDSQQDEKLPSLASCDPFTKSFEIKLVELTSDSPIANPLLIVRKECLEIVSQRTCLPRGDIVEAMSSHKDAQSRRIKTPTLSSNDSLSTAGGRAMVKVPNM